MKLLTDLELLDFCLFAFEISAGTGGNAVFYPSL